MGFAFFVISYLSLSPFLYVKDIIQQHDVLFHFSRMESYYESVKQFDFFPKIFYAFVNGGGYATDLFYPSILLLPYALFRYIGFSTATSYMLYLFLITYITTITTYALGKVVFGKRKTALLLAAIYVLSGYRFQVMILRGALGELLGFAFFPLGLIGLYSILFKDKKYWYFLVIGMALMIMSHMLSAYMFFAFILISCVYKLIICRNKSELFKSGKLLVLSGILTFFLVMWQLLPMLEQMFHMKFNFMHTYLNVPTIDLGSMIKFSLLGNFTDEAIGMRNLGTTLTVALILLWPLIFKMNRTAKVLLVSATFLFVATTSVIPWEMLTETPIKMIQFPFRLFLFCTVLISILVAYAYKNIAKENNIVLVVLLVAIGGLSWHVNHTYQPKFFSLHSVQDVPNHFSVIGGGQEYLKDGIVYEKVVPGVPTEVISEAPDQFELQDVQRAGGLLTITGNAQNEQQIKTPFVYYYGYQAETTDGKKIDTFEKDGRVAFEFPAGVHTIKVFYKKTLIQRVTSVISLLSIIGFIVIVVFFNRNMKRREREESRLSKKEERIEVETEPSIGSRVKRRNSRNS